jgi:hypothetical protein
MVGLALALASALAVPATASARNSFILDTSPDSFAALAVDSTGTGYFAWESKVAGSDDVTKFCKVVRGGTCTGPITLPTPPLNPAPYDSTQVTAAFPILGAGSTVYVVGPRFVAADVVVWTSTDGGATFGPATQVAPSGAYKGTNATDVLPVGSSFDISSHNPGLDFTSVPTTGGGADLTPTGGSTNISGSALGLASGSPVEAFSRLNGGQPQTVDFTAYTGTGDPNSSANWSAPALVTNGILPSLAGGSKGLFLASQDASGGTYVPLNVRKYTPGTGFGAPVTLQTDTNDDNAGHIFQTPASGELFVAWQGATLPDGSTPVRLYSSTDGGATFTDVGAIGQGTPNFALGPDSIRLAAADDGQGFATFTEFGGGSTNLRVATFVPIPAFVLGTATAAPGTFVVSVPTAVSGPGTVTGVATVPAAQAAAKAKKCKAHQVLRHGKCLSTLYGTGSFHATAAGTVKLKIKPTSKTLKTLRAGKRLHVAVTVTFRPSSGGATATKTVIVNVRGKKK